MTTPHKQDTALTTEVTVRPPQSVQSAGGIQLITLEDVWQFAERAARSLLVPDAFRNKPEDIFIALEWGFEIGLRPMNALQSICVIKGRAALWGDAVPGLCMASGLMEWIKLPDLAEIAKTWSATVVVKRVGNPHPFSSTFNKEMAAGANLWDRDTWKAYPERMLLNRARTYACRDAFPDVLRGIAIREELEDIPDDTPRTIPEPTARVIELHPPSSIKEVPPPDAEIVEPASIAPELPLDRRGDRRSHASTPTPQPPPTTAPAPPQSTPAPNLAPGAAPNPPSAASDATPRLIKLRGRDVYTGGVSAVTLIKIQSAAIAFDRKYGQGSALQAILAAFPEDENPPLDWYHCTEEQGQDLIKYLQDN